MDVRLVAVGSLITMFCVSLITMFCVYALTVTFNHIGLDTSIVTATVGQTITLPCRAVHAKNIVIVEWRRTSDPESDYVIRLTRQDSLESTLQPAQYTYQHFNKQLKDGDLSLVLWNVTVDDVGLYTCRIYRARPNYLDWIEEIVCPVTLNITGPDNGGDRCYLIEELTLPCKVADASDIIGVEWRRTDLVEDYVLLYSSCVEGVRQSTLESVYPLRQHPSFYNRVDLLDRRVKDGDASLLLQNVKSADAGIYTCNVYHAERSTKGVTRSLSGSICRSGIFSSTNNINKTRSRSDDRRRGRRRELVLRGRRSRRRRALVVRARRGRLFGLDRCRSLSGVSGSVIVVGRSGINATRSTSGGDDRR
uniref:Ig-like domain-containing protein n=1 Tax=Nothobranchius furzeri TaxID=105023 RepID=A0A8C6VT21_NOTFU